MTERLILIVGGSGFIGRALCRRLARSGCRVAALTRDPGRARAILGVDADAVHWDGRTTENWRDLASRAEAVINLAGENIGGGRWTADRKSEILGVASGQVGRSSRR